ncbi:MAG TPA: hypothetical protein VJ808_12625 [Gemmatimonadales bacterium]|nr:hypothetical protein [Gemmatimonadales bacterium]
MPQEHHSNFREGLVVGLVGASLVLVWYLAVDLGRGELFYTANVLGQVFAQGDSTPSVRSITAPAVVQYSLLHFVWFILFGIVLTALTHLAIRNAALRMGVWLALVTGLALWLGLSYTLYRLTDQRFPWWTFLIGSLLGIGSMGFYLWRRHPALRGSVRERPLGDEVRSPPHPPGGPR